MPAATNRSKGVLLRIVRAVTALGTLAFLPGFTSIHFADQPKPDKRPNSPQLIRALKRLEKRLGFRRTRNFSRRSDEIAAEYRCYYTGKLDLPDSYEELQLAEGSNKGCPVDAAKFDVFFYPLEAVANGKTPVTASLENASTERLLVVIPHEDFHETRELQKLPANVNEPASTLIGFLTATELSLQKFGPSSDVYLHLSSEADLFLRKAEIVNRYQAKLRALYAGVGSGGIARETALAEKAKIFAEMQLECGAINPEPRSFNKCPAALNNAGLAFDATYTKYYPLMYDFYRSGGVKGWGLKATIDTLKQALATRSGGEAIQRVQDLTKQASGRGSP